MYKKLISKSWPLRNLPNKRFRLKINLLLSSSFNYSSKYMNEIFWTLNSISFITYFVNDQKSFNSSKVVHQNRCIAFR